MIPALGLSLVGVGGELMPVFVGNRDGAQL